MDKITLNQSLPDDRLDYLREVKAQDREVDDLLRQLSADVKRAVTRTSRVNEVQDQDTLNSLLNAAFTAYWTGLASVMVRHNNLVNDKQTTHEVTKLIARYPEQNMLSFARQINDSAEKFNLMDRIMAGRKVGERIVTLQGETLRVAQSIVEVGIRNNKSALQIARDLNRYINHPTSKFISPLQWVRERYERLRPSVIHRVPRGSVSFNSYRIARTEINLTYRQAIANANEGKPWFLGYNLILSAAHPKTDICDDLAAQNPHKQIPDTHPFCMCNVETVHKKLEDIKWR